MGKHTRIPVGSRWCFAIMAVMVLVLMVEVVTSQSDNTNNTLIRRYCSQYDVLDEVFFLRNLNNTLSSLRRQLADGIVYHAVARTLINGESVYGLAWCRQYLSNSECVKCFDTAAKEVRVCGIVNGGRAIYDDCDLRFENHNFYTEANVRGNVGVCGNQTSSEPTIYTQIVREMLSDLRVATPRIPDFYVASTRKVAGTNVTVYAIAQCNLNISHNDCAECLWLRSRTLSDCLPYTFGRAINTGCFMRYSNAAFFKSNQTIDLTPFLKAGKSSTKKAIIIGGVSGGVGMLLLLLAFLLWHGSTKSHDRLQQDKSTGASELLQGPMAYTHSYLMNATNNFSQENKVGEGAFGEVYKGTLNDGEVVAIKKITMASRGRKALFNNELKIISNVHHRHLIRLLGYCNMATNLFLVLEFMENGSLDKFLYGEKRGSLNWRQRFDIIFGVARGLAYLHDQYHVTVVHRDIKASNILLDNEFQPKISDFGLVRLLPEDKTHISTKVAGTFGFVAPEYAIHGQVSEKVDTYSFGVLVLEIVSGKRCTDGTKYGSVTHNLIDYAWDLYENGIQVNLIDITLDPSEYVQEDVEKLIELSLMCIQSQASTRPSMSKIVSILSDRSPDQQIQPLRSTFIDESYVSSMSSPS
ncbi:hypothetical protein SSX86_010067 [Deinandra increscens subsp. villosa]|uniref:Cysteine-rich receptor-like protein kinase 2 n=1 Tax=Deinandra increscens subsp. villosa TaxID=3103831 RepID=A0AAP0DI67_9ASTR